jgi:dihydroorotase (multifunctional complex type)
MSSAGRDRWLVSGAQVATPRGMTPADVLVDGSRIAAVAAPGALAAPTRLDADGLWLLPGAIDTHVHPIHNETLASTGAAAPFGGVTTVLHHLYPEPGEPAHDAVRRATSEASTATADFGFHLRLTPDRIDADYAALSGLRPTALKAFLAHTDPEVELSPGQLHEVMRRAAPHDLLVYVHAELGEIVRRAEEIDGGPRTLREWSDARSPALEAAAVQTVCATAALTRCRLHLPHLSSAPALAAAAAARTAGVRVTLETCPHYLVLTCDDQLGGLGRVAPPLRSTTDLLALRSALADGVIDLVASDHCGYAPADKDAASVSASANGVPGLESLLPLLLDAALDGSWLTPHGLVRALCDGPARAFRLRGKGAILPGADADLVLVDPDATTTIRQANLHHRSPYTPYEGRRLRGRIVRVIRRGVTVVEGDHAVDQGGGRGVPVSTA